MTNNKKKRNFKRTFIFIIIYLICLYYWIIYGHLYEFRDYESYFSLLFSLIPTVLISSIFFNDNDSKLRDLVEAFLSVGLLILFLVVHIKIQKLYYDKQLSNYNIETKATVFKYEMWYGKGSDFQKYSVFSYKVKGSFFIQRVSDDNSFYKIGDTLKLSVSTKDFEILKVNSVIRKQ